MFPEKGNEARHKLSESKRLHIILMKHVIKLKQSLKTYLEEEYLTRQQNDTYLRVFHTLAILLVKFDKKL